MSSGVPAEVRRVRAMRGFDYTGDKTREIRFPLGGIGTGCMSLAGDGRLVDWEIFNRPAQNTLNGFSHFAVKAEARGKVLDARVLHGDLRPPYTGSPWRAQFHGMGFGPPRELLAGLPHFRETVFTGTFPIAEVGFREDLFPGRIRLTAFNPFLPLNADDSGIPAAFFEFEVVNTIAESVTYALAATLANPLPANQIHRLHEGRWGTCLHLTSDGVPSQKPEFGDLALATSAARTSLQRYWFRGAWFDALEVFWRDLTTPGPFADRRYAPARAGKGNHALLAAHVRLKPGARETVRFVIAWNFPVRQNDWNRDAAERARKAGLSPYWRNYYSTRWKNSRDSAAYALRNWDRLYEGTRRFRDALFGSTLPREAVDAVSANLATLKSPTVLRLPDGTFYGFEGCHADAGCCEGTCTHVWNYAQALPFLFPDLERTVREADFRHNQQTDGGMPFRLQLPLGIRHPGGRSCADGLFGNVLAVYRDWKIGGDTRWLRALWPRVKRAVAFAWHPGNPDRWDPRKTGVLRGRQHHTLDMELFGPSSWLCGFYLAALKAAAEMAADLRDEPARREFADLFARGRKWVEKHLFNGEYYRHLVDLADRRVLRKHDAVAAYWDAEHGEMKYQIGEGCLTDQVLAQYHANLYGLGEIFPLRRTRKALRAVFRHNFKRSMRREYNPCRVYALNDEAGLVICSWPRGRRKPAIPLTYAQESMHGFEYAAAVLMIQSGLVREGMTLVRAVRDRYDGEKRNPWNEIECGSHYARSMASYALLNAFSGFRFDMRKREIGFRPVQMPGGRFRCFWCLRSGWGEFVCDRTAAELRVMGGELPVRRVLLHLAGLRSVGSVSAGGRRIPFVREGTVVVLDREILLREGQSLCFRSRRNRPSS